MKHVIVVGGGAAGMMAAIIAARKGAKVTLFEKNEKLGKKIFITGKGRCNLTNACEIEELFEAMVSNPRFMYSSFYGFSNADTMDFFRELGLDIKIERGNRVFPVSDRSSDVIRVLKNELQRQNVDVFLNTAVKDVIASGNQFREVILKNGKRVSGDALVITTGGLSYPTTGSTGDGYRWAEKLGHRIVETSPGLVPFVTEEDWVPELQGLSLRNINATIYFGKKKCYEEFGEMLFTHYGVSGPVLISASSRAGNLLKKDKLILSIDLKPALSEEQLDQRILRDFDENKNKQFKNSLNKLLPSKMIPVVIKLSGIDEAKPVNSISKQERKRLISTIKDFRVTLCGLRDYAEAIITRGGVSVKDVDPSTMESKVVSGLYFAGEVLDLDAVTGGYNLQIAWSTAYIAARAITEF